VPLTTAGPPPRRAGRRAQPRVGRIEHLKFSDDRRILGGAVFKSRCKHRSKGTDKGLCQLRSDDIVVQDREELIYLLCEAAEFEHTVMCSYLYAQWTLSAAWTKT